MKRTKKKAFTLVETLVAVAILGLVGAGALKLTALSARTLGEVRAGWESLALSRNFWLRAVSGRLEDRGRGKDQSWESGVFDFPGQKDRPPGFTCRRIVVTPAPDKGGGAIVLYVPDQMISGGKKP